MDLIDTQIRCTIVHDHDVTVHAVYAKYTLPGTVINTQEANYALDQLSPLDCEMNTEISAQLLLSVNKNTRL